MDLKDYKRQLQEELHHILAYWSSKMIDMDNGGFYGQRDGLDVLHPEAEKGCVLNARILWTFSAAHNYQPSSKYLSMAERAYNYLVQYFLDRKYGGMYWSVDFRGRPLKTRKQIYAQAFAIYGLSAYYRASGDARALELAQSLFYLVEKHSYDVASPGYLEAYTQDWQLETDLRLSDKDDNAVKTMNTHLHIIEGYTSLYQVWKDPLLKMRIEGLLKIFTERIIEPQSAHLRLFFDAKWRSSGTTISYGHDIEAAWLLYESAMVLGDAAWIGKMRDYAIRIADAASEGLDKDGGLWYERKNNHLVAEKHWWPQAEAMVGYFTAYKISGNIAYLQKSEAAWAFVQQRLIDRKNGEWFWGIEQDGVIMGREDKAGFWKCPYHNGRACLEIIKNTL